MSDLSNYVMNVVTGISKIYVNGDPKSLTNEQLEAVAKYIADEKERRKKEAYDV